MFSAEKNDPDPEGSMMCGRFYLDARAEDLKATLTLASLPGIEPRYNIAPSQPVLAVMATPATGWGTGYAGG
jgi:putative SOS response-associated peptidase YedK